MRSIIVEDVKNFMGKLLVGTEFDDYLVSEVSITTYNTFTINGRINKNFYSEEELEQISERENSYWKELKPICYDLIKGKKTPLKFKMVFSLTRQNIEKKLVESGLNYSANDINGLFLNILYEKDVLVCTTGISMNLFTLDKSIEEYWDNDVQKLVEKL